MSDGFVDVYDVNTNIKQRVPAHFLDDPILGRNIKKTPSQRALDGDLGQAPTADSTVAEIRDFADQADIDVTGLTRKDDLLAAVTAVVGTDPLPDPVPAGDVAVATSGAAVDIDTPAGVDPTSTDDTESPDETPATGDEEN